MLTAATVNALPVFRCRQSTKILLADAKQRRSAALGRSESRRSIDSLSEEEFFDATDGDTVRSQLLTVRRGSDEDGEEREEDAAAAAVTKSDPDADKTKKRIWTKEKPGGDKKKQYMHLLCKSAHTPHAKQQNKKRRAG